MSRPLSRPRTRLYDANYNIGESYYKGAIDRLDRKYTGRPLSPTRTSASVPRDLLERHDRAFADEDLNISRRRAEKHITENHLFDSRGGRLAQRALDLAENDIDEETASALSRIRANRKIAALDDIDLDNTMNSIKSNRMINRSEKLLDSVGITSDSRRSVDSSNVSSIKKRSLHVSYAADTNADNSELTKWTPLVKEVNADTAAAIRARRSRDKLQEIEDEMSALSEKAAVREKRMARLKQFMAEQADETEANTTAMKSLRVSRRSEKQSLEY